MPKIEIYHLIGEGLGYISSYLVFPRSPMCSYKIFKKLVQKTLLYHYFTYSVKTGTCAKNRNIPSDRGRSWLHFLILGFSQITYVFIQNFQKTGSKNVTIPLFYLQRKNRDMCQKSKYTI